MVYRIVEVTREKVSGRTYLLVQFWLSRADFDARQDAYLTEEFSMSLHPDEARSTIDTNIRNYWRLAQANNWRGDHTTDHTKPFFRKDILQRQRATPPLQRDTTDNGIIERPDVKDIVDVVRE